jgi:hypothetical protein
MQMGSPLLRRRVLLRTLCARHRGAPVEALAAVLSVSGETIRPSLQTFQDSGFPLEETIKDFGRKWRMDPARSQPGLSFAFAEAAVLLSGRPADGAVGRHALLRGGPAGVQENPRVLGHASARVHRDAAGHVDKCSGYVRIRGA